jgi:hypothetical protein
MVGYLIEKDLVWRLVKLEGSSDDSALITMS